MEWLSRWWRDLFRDVVLTGSGLAVIGSQVFSARPNVGLIGAGLALTAPSTYVRLRDVVRDGSPGSTPPASPPPPPEPSPASSGRTGE